VVVLALILEVKDRQDVVIELDTPGGSSFTP